MDKLNQPTTSSAPRSERDTPAGTNHSSMASARWEAPTGRRKIVPGVVIGVAVAALFVGMDYKFKHKAENTVDTPAVAQGPAVESMVNEAPTAAGPSHATESTVGTAAPTSTAPVAETPPAATAPATTPAPAPRREATRSRPQPVQATPPVNEAPADTAPSPMPSTTPEPVQSAPAPAAEPAAPTPVPQPAPTPAPEPAPSN